MAASVIAAVIERFNTLTFAAVPAPKLWFDEAPLRDGAGATVTPPYVVLKDDGTVPDYDFELMSIEVTTFRFEIYAPGLAAADAIADVIRYGVGAIAAGMGFDFATTLEVTGQTLMQCVRDFEQRFQEADRGTDSKPVFRVRMRYRVQMQRG